MTEKMMKEQNKQKEGLNIGVKSFIGAIAVIFILMIATYVLTLMIPGGQYARSVDEMGNTVVNVEQGFTFIRGGLPFWKWALSPFLVLGANGGGTLIAVIAFLLVIGGVFNSLDKCGLMKRMLDLLVNKFGGVRYRLMAVVTFFFMALGAMIGSFEECVPLVPIVVALSIKLGWDALTGLSMSMLAVGCGFASGICNPFTVGVAQQLAGLSMFSGAWMRILAFVFIYALLILFNVTHAKRLDRIAGKEQGSACEVHTIEADPKKDKAVLVFASILGVGILAVLCSGFITALQDYTMIIVAVMFLCAGIFSTLISGMKGSELGRSFYDGVVGILPAVVMILMASSIKYTLEEAHTLDTVLYYAVQLAENLPGWCVILFIYLIVLMMNFFIPSGSAKAFMLIPLIVPMAQIFGIPVQLCIVAFAFGDGFSNVFYPTNPALLISLGVADVSYGRWFKFSWKFQAMNLILTSLLLLFGLWVGYC